ncbi:MAG TPA: hypothetical protein GXX77_05980 [Candidatus Cloacimonetes bacterium]|nr:hypothetical protein [Candidatus Cloacimonadota bacterium]
MQNFMSVEEFLSLPEDRQIMPKTLNQLSFDNLVDILNNDSLSEKVRGVLEGELNFRSVPSKPILEKEVMSQKNELPSYPALKAISAILKFIGWILLVIGIIYFVYIIVQISEASFYEKGALLAQLPLALGLGIAGVLNIAGAEIIKLFTDISRNTAAILKRLDGK